MKYAKQRVDSEMEPAARFVLFFEAMLTTAIAISIERKGRVEAQYAEHFLAFIIAEHVVQLGIWGDSDNEVLKLARPPLTLVRLSGHLCTSRRVPPARRMPVH